jgi:hypothetical protein
MDNQATSIELFFGKTVNRNATTSKLLKLNILDKTVVVLYVSLPLIIASIALVLFKSTLKIGLSRGFSGFCNGNEFNTRCDETR